MKAAVAGAERPGAVIQVEEPVADLGHIGGDGAARHNLRAEPLARGQRASIAGLLEAGLGQVVAPHIDPAANQREQGEQTGGEHGQGVAGHVTPQERQEVPTCQRACLVRIIDHVRLRPDLGWRRA